MKRKIVYIFIALVIVVPSLMVTISTMISLSYHVSLTFAGLPAKATITASRISTSYRVKELYEVRYTFEVDEKTFPAQDGTKSTPLWATLSKENWESAKERGSIDILYKKSNPSISQPVFMENHFMLDSVALLVLFLSLSAISGYTIYHNLQIISKHFHH